MIGTEIGPFTVERELGSGAMGTVYRAVYRETGQHVAIKIIALGLTGNETAMKRFERECSILKQLKHPNIVRLLATGRFRKTPFFAMEFVEGESLDHILHRKGKFAWQEVVQIGIQLCAALQHAHDKGIIHRDLKPSNLMILKDGTMKLTDFGIAKDADLTALTANNCTVGTASYMSPEQCRGERTLSHKSDLYSMGVVFFELLTGEKPFKAESPVDMFMAHVNKTPERPSRRVMDVPVWLDTLIMQLLEKKPDHRPRDGLMVGEVLKEIQEKASAGRSAGVDAVSGRTVEQTVSAKFTNTADQDAARALRATVTKKRPRKRTPTGLPTGVQALLLILALGTLCGLVYFFALRPKSFETLYAEAKAAHETRNLLRLERAHEQFQAHYGQRDDASARQLHEWYQEDEVAQAERQMFNRFRTGWNADSELESIAFRAVKAENDGLTHEAAEQWRALADTGKTANAPIQVWLAGKKLADLKALSQREADLQKRAGEIRLHGPAPVAPASDEERRALEATRYELLGDFPAARDRWRRLRDDALRRPEVRDYFVLSARKARETGERSPPTAERDRQFRRDLLRDKFVELDRSRDPNDRGWVSRARMMFREIAELYRDDGDADLGDFAKQAERRLRELPNDL